MADSEQEAEKRIYEALCKASVDFQNYVKDFRVRKPSEIVRVEYLKKGAFLRYIMKKVKEGAAWPDQISYNHCSG